MLEQQKKLESEEEEAGDKLLELHTQLADLQSQLSTAVNRLARIRKIRNRVKDKSSELFRRGMAELDAEDGILPALDAHERWVVNDLGAMGVPKESDWSAFGLGEEFLDLGPLIPPAPSGETASTGAGTSSGAS